MSEPIEVAIAKALLTQLDTPTLGYSVAHPFVTFTPTTGTPYLDAHPVMRAEPEHPALGFTGSTLKRGIFQVDVVIHANGTGESPGLRIAALVAARFAIGTTLTAGGRKLQLNFVPTIATPVKDAPWLRFPVSIPFLVIE